jgi:plastocyanin
LTRPRLGTTLAQSSTTPALIEVVVMAKRFPRTLHRAFPHPLVSRPTVLHPGVWLTAALLGMIVVTASCGGDDDNDPTGGPSGSGNSTATLTIAAGGVVSPSAVTINRGDRVTFVNNDTEPHTMSSNPHPVHTDCPALNVGTLGPGQQRDSGTLNTSRVCGFHDHDNPDSPGLQGTVRIQ